MKWTPDRVGALEQMWLWGIPSGTIAHNLGGVSRNAVMGRINRCGFMGRGGEYIGREHSDPQIDVHELHRTVATLMRDEYDHDDPLHRHAAVAVTCLLVGHSVNAVTVSGAAPALQATQTIRAMDHTGVWRIGATPPPAWWHHDEGWMAFLLDMMTTQGMILMKTTDRLGGRSYWHPDNDEGEHV